jgi:hypothetical protein
MTEEASCQSSSSTVVRVEMQLGFGWSSQVCSQKVVLLSFATLLGFATVLHVLSTTTGRLLFCRTSSKPLSIYPPELFRVLGKVI